MIRNPHTYRAPPADDIGIRHARRGDQLHAVRAWEDSAQDRVPRLGHLGVSRQLAEIGNQERERSANPIDTPHGQDALDRAAPIEGTPDPVQRVGWKRDHPARLENVEGGPIRVGQRNNDWGGQGTLT